MSGAEPAAVLGLISSVIAIVEASQRIYQATHDASGLPEAFRSTSQNIPLVLSTLQDVRRVQEQADEEYKQTQDPVKKKEIEEEARAVQVAVERCKSNAEALQEIFEKVIPGDKASRRERYFKAARTVVPGKKTQVEDLMSEILTKLQALHVRYFFKQAAETREQKSAQLDEAIKKLSELESLIRGASNAVESVPDWLTAPDPYTDYINALKLREDHTGSWLLNNEHYQRWKTGDTSSMWLVGIPGCGKTVMSATIVQDIQNHCATDGSSVVYFYFNFKSASKQNLSVMIKSLIIQLLRLGHALPSAMEKLMMSGTTTSQPSIYVLLDYLQQMTQTAKGCYIILDALDECRDRSELLSTVTQMIGWEKAHILFTSREDADIKDALERSVERDATIPFRSENVDEDIRFYLRRKLLRDPGFRRWRTKPAVLRDIETKLTDKSRGMFRWVECQLQTLSSCYNQAQLKEALGHLPETLDETYERILLDIKNSSYRYALSILRWLAFSARPLLASEIAEVVAIDVDRDPPIDRYEVLDDPMDILRICSSLVTTATVEEEHLDDSSANEAEPSHPEFRSAVPAFQQERELDRLVMARATSAAPFYFKRILSRDSTLASSGSEKDSIASDASDHQSMQLSEELQSDDSSAQGSSVVVSLSHASVKDYLLSSRIADGNASRFSLKNGTSHEVIAKSCLFDLFQFDNERLSRAEMMSTSQLSTYSADFWAYHAREAQPGSVSLDDLVVEFLQSRKIAFSNSMRLHKSQNPISRRKKDQDDQAFNHDYHGHSSGLGFLRRMRDQMGDLQSPDTGSTRLKPYPPMSNGPGTPSTAIYYASLNGLAEAVRRLRRDFNADVNANGGRYGNPLQAASARGYESVVQFLLDEGAEVNANGGFYERSLHAASSNGHDSVVDKLLLANANIDASDSKGMTALHAAIVASRFDVVKRLLAAGASVTKADRHGRTAIDLASLVGYGRTIMYVLDKSISTSPPLHQAAYHGQMDLLHKLLDEDPKIVDGIDDSGASALHVASQNCQEAACLALVEAGADCNLVCQNWGTALHCASYRGLYDTVKSMLKHNADVNVVKELGDWTPLQLATLLGHARIVKLLLARNADVTLRNDRGQTAEDIAEESSNEKILALLRGQSTGRLPQEGAKAAKWPNRPDVRLDSPDYEPGTAKYIGPRKKGR